MSTASSTPRAEIGLGYVKLWLFYCTLCTLAGWTLSALHRLDALSWLIFALLLSLPLLPWLGPTAGLPRTLRPSALRALWRRRFRRPLPFLFAGFVLFVTLRGIANPRLFSGDAGSYRLPRVLHWIAAGGWHWIDATDPRLNTRANGFEWMATPFVLFGHSVDWTFLLTVLSFALMPALIFLTFRELGVRSRVAWNWAWVLPGSYYYLWQAGTVSTDGTGAIFALAAVGLALRARATRSLPLAFYSLLAAALLSNQKASNLPLLLPFAVAWWPNLRATLARPAVSIAVGLLVLSVSFLPIATANYLHTHSITGLSAETDIAKPAPWWAAILGNLTLLTAYQLTPPLTGSTAFLFDTVFIPGLNENLSTYFEVGYGVMPSLPTQDISGSGLGVTLLLLACSSFRSGASSPDKVRRARPVRWGACAATLFVMAKSTLAGLPRILSPYYPLLVPSLLLGSRSERVVRGRIWQVCAIANGVISLVLLGVTADNPIWPLRAAYSYAERTDLPPGLQRLAQSYSCGTKAMDFFYSTLREIPAQEKAIGLVREWDEPELFAWHPIGSHRVFHTMPVDTREQLLARGIHYVLLGPQIHSPDQYCARFGAEVIGTYDFTYPGIRLLRVRLLKLRTE